MPQTYTPIASTTLTSAQSSVTFSSISSAYTDLVLVMFARDTGSTSATNAAVTVNSDTGSNYSWTNLYGNGSVAGSTRNSNQTSWLVPVVPNSATANVFSSTVCHFMNYSNTTTYKTMLTRADNPTDAAVTRAMLWRSTAAISTMNIAATAGNLAIGSTFTLYGIKQFT